MLMDGILKGLRKREYRADSTHNIIPLVNHPMNKCSIGTMWVDLGNARQMENFNCSLLHLAGTTFNEKNVISQSSTQNST